MKVLDRVFSFTGKQLLIAVVVILCLFKGCSSCKENKIAKVKLQATEVTDSLCSVINNQQDSIKVILQEITFLKKTLVAAEKQIADLKLDKRNLSDVNRQNARTIKNMTDEKAN